MKIFAILPASIIGEMIIKGISRGFEKLGMQVLAYDARNVDEKKVREFAPDYIFGWDYIFFQDEALEKFADSLNTPVIHYFIDAPKSVFSHGGREHWLDKLNNRKNSIVFCWDEKYIDDFSPRAKYLSTGLDFDLYEHDYPEIDLPPSKILFAGRPLTDRRESIIAEIVKHFPDTLSIYCYPPHFEQSMNNMLKKGYLNQKQAQEYKKCYRGFLPDEKHLAAAYHRAEMIVNITLEQGFSSLNSRVLESLATKSFLITDYIEDTSRYFTEDEDLLMYRNTDELINYIREYKDAPEKRARFEGRAIEKIKANHTLESRAALILEYLLREINIKK